MNWGIWFLKASKHMTPAIHHTSFGSITVEGQQYDYDIVISLEGEVRKRKKKLSKALYGTSHKISADEIQDLYQKGSQGLIIGSGQYGVAVLSQEAERYLENNHCPTIIKPTPEAIREWNSRTGKWLGLFHITC
jgi:hypothetical protein